MVRPQHACAAVAQVRQIVYAAHPVDVPGIVPVVLE
jgi:hypothetical protein